MRLRSPIVAPLRCPKGAVGGSPRCILGVGHLKGSPLYILSDLKNGIPLWVPVGERMGSKILKIHFFCEKSTPAGGCLRGVPGVA